MVIDFWLCNYEISGISAFRDLKMGQVFHGNYNTFRLDSNEFLMTEHFFFQRLKSSFIPYLIMCAK